MYIFTCMYIYIHIFICIYIHTCTLYTYMQSHMFFVGLFCCLLLIDTGPILGIYIVSQVVSAAMHFNTVQHTATHLQQTSILWQMCCTAGCRWCTGRLDKTMLPVSCGEVRLGEGEKEEQREGTRVRQRQKETDRLIDRQRQRQSYIVLQCVAVCCSVLQCVVVCCSVLRKSEHTVTHCIKLHYTATHYSNKTWHALLADTLCLHVYLYVCVVEYLWRGDSKCRGIQRFFTRCPQICVEDLNRWFIDLLLCVCVKNIPVRCSELQCLGLAIWRHHCNPPLTPKNRWTNRNGRGIGWIPPE